MAKYALVTGGNRGIGLEVSRQLLEHGKPVLLACRDISKGQAVAAELADKQPGSKVEVVQLDTGDSGSSIQQLAKLIKEQYSEQIDLLVNNAGILIPKVWDKATFDETLTVNVAGPVNLSRTLLPLLAPGALVIMVSSGLGELANLTPEYLQAVQGSTSLDAVLSVPFLPDSAMGSPEPPGSAGMSPTYSAAKALLNRAVQLLDAEPAFQARGVHVVSTCPGWCRTDMGSAAAGRSAEQGASSVLWPHLNWNKSLAASFTRDGERIKW